ncbi:hypothetical protein [Streptomyces sp. NPDC056883]|uniref:hypothetical protein n=1 Tax=Streptomyces sp. NPDC056883 TaxID=3345959 RepID=UPI0036A4B497
MEEAEQGLLTHRPQDPLSSRQAETDSGAGRASAPGEGATTVGAAICRLRCRLDASQAERAVAAGVRPLLHRKGAR